MKSNFPLLWMVLLSILLISPGAVLAQGQVISGKVTDAVDQSPIVGASVIVKGTQTGTATDLEGNFSLEVSPGSILVISSMGYATREIQVNEQSVINVALELGSGCLNEVAVVGYKTVSKRKRSGGVTTNNTACSQDVR